MWACPSPSASTPAMWNAPSVTLAGTIVLSRWSEQVPLRCNVQVHRSRQCEIMLGERHADGVPVPV
jgi:hypothetical protein